MIRLTRASKFRVSNRLAALAAFLLVAATVASVSAPIGSDIAADGSMLADSQEVATQPAGSDIATVSRNKGFKVSLYLFRRN